MFVSGANQQAPVTVMLTRTRVWINSRNLHWFSKNCPNMAKMIHKRLFLLKFAPIPVLFLYCHRYVRLDVCCWSFYCSLCRLCQENPWVVDPLGPLFITRYQKSPIVHNLFRWVEHFLNFKEGQGIGNYLKRSKVVRRQRLVADLFRGTI